LHIQQGKFLTRPIHSLSALLGGGHFLLIYAPHFIKLRFADKLTSIRMKLAHKLMGFTFAYTAFVFIYAFYFKFTHNMPIYGGWRPDILNPYAPITGD